MKSNIKVSRFLTSMDRGKSYLSYDMYYNIIDSILRELCIKTVLRPQPQLSILKIVIGTVN